MSVTPALSTQDHGAMSHQHQLPNGSLLELLEMRPSGTDITRAAQPPLLFLHGASHGAWCWEVRFYVMPPLSCPAFSVMSCHP